MRRPTFTDINNHTTTTTTLEEEEENVFKAAGWRARARSDLHHTRYTRVYSPVDLNTQRERKSKEIDLKDFTLPTALLFSCPDSFFFFNYYYKI